MDCKTKNSLRRIISGNRYVHVVSAESVNKEMTQVHISM